MQSDDIGVLNGKKGLFNGNIASMLTSIRRFDEGAPHAMAYRYDQLNRIKEAVNYKYQNNAWGKNGNSFATSYSYDGNGNILNLTRNNQAGEEIHRLAYDYT